MFFLLLSVTCIPAYFFTSLWHRRPFSVTVIIIVTAILQMSALYFLWQLLYKSMEPLYIALPAVCRWLFSLAIAAFILKVLLQFFSVHPGLSQIAFGFRPIIISYLHLIFLAFISRYLMRIITDKKIISLHYRVTFFGLITLAAGIIINEILLAIQGFASIYYLYLPNMNLLLFANAFTMVAGAVLLFITVKKRPAFNTNSIS